MGSLLAFFSLTFVVTWTCFLAAGAVWGSPGAPAHPLGWLRWPLLYLGIFAPGLVALGLTARAEGSEGTRALLSRLFQWRVGARWYVFAVLYMAAIKLSTALVHRVATGAWPTFGRDAWYVILLGTVGSTVMGGQAGEEIGWRGYALPRLAERLGLGGGSLVLGVIWALWHLPLFFVIPEGSTYRQSFPTYLLSVTALSVAIAWLYGHTQGSLLLTMLMHSAVNHSKDIVPSVAPGATSPFGWSPSLVAWITVALLCTCAVVFLARMPRLRRD